MTLVKNYFLYQCARFQILHPVFQLDGCLFACLFVVFAVVVFKFSYRNKRLERMYSER